MERTPVAQWLNTFANIVLTKDNEQASPRYEYFDLNENSLRLIDAVDEARDFQNSLAMLTFLDYESEQEASSYFYIRLVGEDMEVIVSSIVPEEEIENGQVFGPFRDIETLQYYMHKTREKV